MALVTKRRFTIVEYQKMGSSGILTEDEHVELIDGQIVETPPIGSRHAGQVTRLNAVLHRLVSERAIVSVRDPVDLDDYSEPEPDLTLLRPRPDCYAARHPRPADVLLLIEVSDSLADYDREVKLPLYARAGIPEVWIVDLAAPEGVEVYAGPWSAGYARALRAARGETLAVPGLPGVTVEVDAMLG